MFSAQGSVFDHFFTWPNLKRYVFKQLMACKECQLHCAARRSDLIPITPIVRPTLPFVMCNVDIIGPLEPASSLSQRWCLTIVDSCTRYPYVYLLRSVTSQSICDCLVDLFMHTGIYQIIVMDNGSNFASKLTANFLKMFGVSPRFVSPYHPQANGLVERFNSSFKTLLHLAMREFGRAWHKAVPFLVWVLRESPNATTGLSPFPLQHGIPPRGILNLFKQEIMGVETIPGSKTVEKISF